MWARFDVFDGVWKGDDLLFVNRQLDRKSPFRPSCSSLLPAPRPTKRVGKVHFDRFDHSPFSDNGFAASFVADAHPPLPTRKSPTQP